MSEEVGVVMFLILNAIVLIGFWFHRDKFK